MKIRALLGMAFLSALMCSSSSAQNTLLFKDDFNRPGDWAVGNGWQETNATKTFLQDSVFYSKSISLGENISAIYRPMAIDSLKTYSFSFLVASNNATSNYVFLSFGAFLTDPKSPQLDTGYLGLWFALSYDPGRAAHEVRIFQNGAQTGSIALNDAYRPDADAYTRIEGSFSQGILDLTIDFLNDGTKVETFSIPVQSPHDYGNYFIIGNYDGIGAGVVLYTFDDLVITESQGKQLDSDSNTIALWHLNEGVGTTFHDATSNHNDGTMIDANWTDDGRFAKALQFDGTGDYLTVPISPSLQSISNDATIEMWFQYTGMTTSSYTLWRWGTNLNSVTSEAKIAQGDRKLRALFHAAGQALGGRELMSKNPLNENEWYHVALCYNGEKEQLFINGELQDEVTANSNVDIPDDKFWIGRNGNATNPKFFNGKIDEVRISDIARYAVNNPQISPSVVDSQLIAGSEFWVDIKVGANQPVANLFGVSFTLDYSTTYLEIVPPYANSVIPGDFMGNDVVFFQSVDESVGHANIGISRKAGQGGISGAGVIAKIRFIVSASTPNGTKVTFSISNVTANDPAGNPIPLSVDSVNITISAYIVWPGDTDNNNTVNQADILPIGLYWNKTGPARISPTINWLGQPAMAWNPVNSTYADANGDGLVNQADVLPIGLNWNRTHSQNSPIAAKNSARLTTSISGEAKLIVSTTGKGMPGENFWIEVRVENVKDLFGISFELIYSPTHYTVPQSVESSEWMGQDVLFFANLDSVAGKISIGLSRKAGQGGVDGTGLIARIKMKMLAEAEIGQVIHFSLQNVQANDSSGQAIQLELADFSVVTNVIQGNPSTRPAAFALYSAYPNPFNPKTRIEYDLPSKATIRLQVFDITGKLVATLVDGTQQVGSYQVIWKAKDRFGRHVPSGMYIYRLHAVWGIGHTKHHFTAAHKMLLIR